MKRRKNNFGLNSKSEPIKEETDIEAQRERGHISEGGAGVERPITADEERPARWSIGNSEDAILNGSEEDIVVVNPRDHWKGTSHTNVEANTQRIPVVPTAGEEA